MIAAASEIFVLRGYHAASVREISQRARVTKPTIYKYFAGKLDLYLAVLQGHLDELVSGVRQAIDAAGGTEECVRAAVAAYFDFVDQDSEAFRLIFGSTVLSEPAVQSRVHQANEACIDAICALFGHIPDAIPHRIRLLATALVGASELIACDWLEAGRAIPKADAVETTVALCWTGLSAVSLQRPE